MVGLGASIREEIFAAWTNQLLQICYYILVTFSNLRMFLALFHYITYSNLFDSELQDGQLLFFAASLF